MDQIDVEEKYEEADVDTEQDDDDEEEEDKGEERTEKQQSTDMYSINGGGRSTWTQSWTLWCYLFYLFIYLFIYLILTKANALLCKHNHILSENTMMNDFIWFIKIGQWKHKVSVVRRSCMHHWHSHSI